MSWSTIADTRLDTLVRELQVALIERGIQKLRTTPGYNVFTCPVIAGENIQSYRLYEGMQGAIEAAAPGFIDMDAGPLNPAQDGFVRYEDLETFAEKAGLIYPGLWRRKVDYAADFSYGKMQIDDIIDPSWIIEDFRKALSVMTAWQLPTYYEYIGNIYKTGGGGTKAAAEAAFASAEWKYGSSNYELGATSRQDYGVNFSLFRGSPGANVFNISEIDHPLRKYGSSGTIRVFIKGEVDKYGEFSSNGDLGIVEGTGSTILHPGRVIQYPEGLTLVENSNYHALPTGDAVPAWGPEDPTKDVRLGYGHSIIDVWDILHVQYLIEPDFTYG